MKKFYTLASTVLHPVFLPIFIVFLYLNANVPSEDYKWLLFPAWVLFLNLILPGMYLKHMKKDVDVFKPTLAQRESIYKIFMLVSFVLSFVFILMARNIGLFFLAQLVMFFLLFMLTKYKIKASWHLAGWLQLVFGFLLAYAQTLLIEYVYLMVIGAILTLVVLLSRKRLNAHSSFEFLMGSAVGIISILPLLFLT